MARITFGKLEQYLNEHSFETEFYDDGKVKTIDFGIPVKGERMFKINNCNGFNFNYTECKGKFIRKKYKSFKSLTSFFYFLSGNINDFLKIQKEKEIYDKQLEELIVKDDDDFLTRLVTIKLNGDFKQLYDVLFNGGCSYDNCFAVINKKRSLIDIFSHYEKMFDLMNEVNFLNTFGFELSANYDYIIKYFYYAREARGNSFYVLKEFEDLKF